MSTMVSRRFAAVWAGVVCVALSAAPHRSLAVTPIALDDFSTKPTQSNLLTDAQAYVANDTGTFAGETNQLRSAYYYHYFPTITTATTSTATLGTGGVSVQAAPGEIGELALGYGAYAQGGAENGKLLNLDLSQYDDLQVQFSKLDGPINLLVGFYTSVPGADGIYYWDGEVNYTPTHPGGPATVDILFKGRDQYQSTFPPVYSDPTQYDFSKIDGVTFIVDRAAQSEGNGYEITNLTFTTAPVPEPATLGLASMGGLVLAARMGRSR